jgi:hypothetical protein
VRGCNLSQDLRAVGHILLVTLPTLPLLESAGAAAPLLLALLLATADRWGRGLRRQALLVLRCATLALVALLLWASWAALAMRIQ